MGLKKLNTLNLFTNQGLCQIELLIGDITTVTDRDKVDILAVSTHPRTFSIRNESTMKALKKNMDISIDELKQNMERDLRKDYRCWVSKPLPTDLPFGRLVCFEKQANSKNPCNAIRNIFRAFTPIFDYHDRTVMTNLLGTWYQDFNLAEVLNMTVNAACNWIKVGLQLRCLKIVLCRPSETDRQNSIIEIEECIEEFDKLVEKWTISKCLRFSAKYDVYISYSPQDEKKAEVLASTLIQANEKLKIFYKPKSKCMKAWPEEAMLKIYGCKRFLPLLSSYYMKNKDCMDEFMTAICYQNQLKDLKLSPLYMEQFRSLPPVIRNIPFLDCRLSRGENLPDKFSTACGNIMRDLTINELELKPPSADHDIIYDIYISYPEKYWKVVETVYKILKRHNPKLNIFYDKLGLKRDRNWTLSIYKALEQVRCCIVLVSPAYIESFMCQEEFNVVVARRLFEDCKKEMAVIPVCIYDVFFIPDWFGQLNILDARGSLFKPTIEMLSAKLNQSFKNDTVQEDFDWLLKHEISKNVCLKGELHRYRLQQFCNRFFQHEAMVVPKEDPGSLVSPCSILICFSTYDRRIAGLLVDILLKEIPCVNIMLLNNRPGINEESFYQLNKADHIVMFVCEDFLTSPRGLEVLSVCLRRQRRAEHRILHFACTSLIPDCLSYLKILPYSVLFTDQIWWDVRKRYPENDYTRVNVRGVNGKFNCEKFEYMALEKLAQDILISERFGCAMLDEIENLVPVLKICQEIPNFFTLDELLVPLPREYRDLCCLEESLFEENDEETEPANE